MKKIVSIFLVITLTLSMTFIGDIAVSAAQSGDFTYTVVSNTSKITKYTGPGGTVVIPSALGGYPVTLIDDRAFLDCTGLTKVTIPDTVTEIGYQAFDGCSGLISVNIPGYVTKIWDSAFYRCSKLAAITFPESIKWIGEEAFYFCSKLKSVMIPAGVTNIGNGAFSSCAALTQINVDTNNTQYSSQSGVLFNKTVTTLLQCPAGKTGNYTIPGTVTTVIAYAFNKCAELSTVTIPGSVTYIAFSAFFGCKGLTCAIFLGDAPTMDSRVFDGCAATFTVSYIDGKSGFSNPWNGYEATGKLDTPVTGVSLNKTGVTLKVNGTYQPNATISPSNTIYSTLNWKSSNTKVATVSATGKITAKTRGLATITVTTVNGSKTATIKVTVIQPVKSVMLNKKSITIKKGSSYTLRATVNPTNANNRSVTWKSSNKSIATVSKNGIVKGIKKGTAYISVYTVDGGKTAKCKVIVK